MNLTFESVLEYGLDCALDLLNRGFADYVVPIELDAAELHRIVVQDSIDVSSSRVLVRDGQPAGIALIARRGGRPGWRRWPSSLRRGARASEAG